MSTTSNGDLLSLHHNTRFPTDVGRQKSKSSSDCRSGKLLSDSWSGKIVHNDKLSVGIVSSFSIKLSVDDSYIPIRTLVGIV
jgi:hypothetical protein